MSTNVRVQRVIRVSDQENKGYVDWPAIIAGSLVAAAIFFVFNAFGTVLGLSLSAPRLTEGDSNAAKGYAVAVGLWILWITITSFVAGGYLAGRLRRAIPDSDGHETNVRDGVHGLVVWAAGILVGAWLASSAIAGITKTTADVATNVAPAAASMAMNEAQSGYLADDLLRNPAQATGDQTATRGEVSRIVLRSASNGAISSEDRTYLTQLAASRAGISQADAEKRIDAASAKLKEAQEKAKQAAISARRIGILVAFLTAASLLVGAVGAWWGASVGGRHRDENSDYGHLVRW